MGKVIECAYNFGCLEEKDKFGREDRDMIIEKFGGLEDIFGDKRGRKKDIMREK